MTLFKDANAQIVLDHVEYFVKDIEKLEAHFMQDDENFEECFQRVEAQKRSLEELIKKAQDSIEDVATKYNFQQDIQSNDEYSENLRISINVLTNELDTVQNELVDKEKSLKKTQKHMDMLTKEKKRIEELKNVIQSFKALTKTTFVFSAEGVRGVMVTKNGPRAFDFPKETSQNEITESLWKMLAKES